MKKRTRQEHYMEALRLIAALETSLDGLSESLGDDSALDDLVGRIADARYDWAIRNELDPLGREDNSTTNN